MKIGKLHLIAIIFIVGYYYSGVYNFQRDENYKLMLDAARHMKIVSNKILERKIEKGIEVDYGLDINKTGLIGHEYTEITTTLGNLESKRTSTNPDFAALFVKILKERGLQKGDKVAVNMSGSFPALNIALIIALDLLELEGVIISSLGASTYGANNPEFTYLDIEDFLLKEKLIFNHSKAYSLGGDGDLGENFEEEYKEKILERFRDGNRKFFHIAEYKKNIEERLKHYLSFGEIKTFINIGGNLVSENLLKEFSDRGIDTISFLNIKLIALKYKIPLDPMPLPEIGKSKLYSN